MATNTASSAWLQKQRKSDLVGLAEQVGLKDYDNLKKADLEVALDEHLRANETRLSKDTNLQAFFNKISAATSPVKKAIKDITSGDEMAPPKKTPRVRRPTKTARDSLEQTDSELDSKSSALVARARRASLSFANSVRLPPSPSVVADRIDAETAKVRSSVAKAWEKSGVSDLAESIRETLSTTVTIELLATVIEAYGLRFAILPMRYLTTVPGVKQFGTSDVAIRIPDLFVLLTSTFWAPLSLWVVTSIVLPLVFAYFFNLTLKAKRSHSRGAGLPATFDPLTFNVAKALIAWLVYGKGFGVGNWISVGSAAGVEASVPGGYKGIVVSSGIGALTSVYEAVLMK